MFSPKFKFWAPLVAATWVCLGTSSAMARPPGPQAFCEVYPDTPVCAGGSTQCTTCHVQTPALNVYGEQLAEALAPGEPRPLSDSVFVEALPEGLAQIEGLDADGDGATNLDELMIGTSPSDAQDSPKDGPSECSAAVIPIDYDVCAYDHAYVFKKVHLDFCGWSPSLEEMRAFEKVADPDAAIELALDQCLDTEYWRGRDGVVWNMANAKIAPIQAVKSGEGEGPIPLADYLDDYNFFVYVNTDDRDVRDLLTGDYYVSREDPSIGVPTTVYKSFKTDRRLLGDFETAQLVTVPSQRAGMLTHRWFLMSMIMFTSVPRTAAAQAYRAYLGKDISRLEGLVPIEGEPVDYDDKGVQAEECAVCHSTLDPLTYPFSTYEGIGGGDGDFFDDFTPFSYSPGRVERFVTVDGPGVADTPEQGYILGQPVENLAEWAEVAAESDEFLQKVTFDYWELLIGEAPRASEQEQYNQLWRDLREKNDYRVEAMLHDLIKTEAYGVP